MSDIQDVCDPQVVDIVTAMTYRLMIALLAQTLCLWRYWSATQISDDMIGITHRTDITPRQLIMWLMSHKDF